MSSHRVQEGNVTESPRSLMDSTTGGGFEDPVAQTQKKMHCLSYLNAPSPMTKTCELNFKTKTKSSHSKLGLPAAHRINQVSTEASISHHSKSGEESQTRHDQYDKNSHDPIPLRKCLVTNSNKPVESTSFNDCLSVAQINGYFVTGLLASKN